jgi:hypothetical protein
VTTMWEADVERANQQPNDDSPKRPHRRLIFSDPSRFKYLHGSLAEQIRLTDNIAKAGSAADDGGRMLPCVIVILCLILMCFAIGGIRFFIR